MAKPSKQQPAIPVGVNVNGTFFTAVKDSHLLAVALQITVEAGVVTEAKIISRAPDLFQSAIGACSRETWVALRRQDKSKVLPDAQ